MRNSFSLQLDLAKTEIDSLNWRLHNDGQPQPCFGVVQRFVFILLVGLCFETNEFTIAMQETSDATGDAIW